MHYYIRVYTRVTYYANHTLRKKHRLGILTAITRLYIRKRLVFYNEMALRKITTKLELTILIVARFNFIDVQIDWYRLNNATMCVIHLEMYLD